jgi:hypothetical protein
MKRIFVFLAALLTCVAAYAADDSKSYTEGPVSVVTSVKLVDGQMDNYMAYLDKTYKQIMEDAKKAGIILDYMIYSGDPRGPNDADLYLVVVYPNMASLDGLDDKMEPLMKKAAGLTRSQASAASGERTKMRTIMGSETVRELKLK